MKRKINPDLLEYVITGTINKNSFHFDKFYNCINDGCVDYCWGHHSISIPFFIYKCQNIIEQKGISYKFKNGKYNVKNKDGITITSNDKFDIFSRAVEEFVINYIPSR